MAAATCMPVPIERIAQGTRMRVEWWGRCDYARSLVLQEAALEERRQGGDGKGAGMGDDEGAGDRLILLEHPPVITCGRSSDAAHILARAADLERDGIEVVQVRRGGDVTYHAPGQLVGYFICDLRARGAVDLHAHLRALESALIDALEKLGVPGEPVPGKTGVFVAAGSGPRRKIASIGIGVRHWITYHGFALNVSVDLSGFERIVPCGLHDVRMTSVVEELDSVADTAELDAAARHAISAAFLARFD